MTYFETDRLIIRRFAPEDGEALYDYLSLEEVVKYEPYGVFTLEASGKEARCRANNDAFWAVCLKGDDRLIGNVYLKCVEPGHLRTWEIGYVFNPKFYKNGYATESCSRLMEYAFIERDAHRITAHCNPENTPSWKLLQRLGMRRESHLLKNMYFRKDVQGRPIWHDTYGYGLLEKEWCTLHGWQKTPEK